MLQKNTHSDVERHPGIVGVDVRKLVAYDAFVITCIWANVSLLAAAPGFVQFDCCCAV
jgi:hypothetical protein